MSPHFSLENGKGKEHFHLNSSPKLVCGLTNFPPKLNLDHKHRYGVMPQKGQFFICLDQVLSCASLNYEQYVRAIANRANVDLNVHYKSSTFFECQLFRTFWFCFCFTIISNLLVFDCFFMVRNDPCQHLKSVGLSLPRSFVSILDIFCWGRTS